MEPEKQNGNGFKVVTPLFSFVGTGKRVAELAVILCLAVLVLLAHLLYEHRMDTRDAQKELALAIREFAVEQKKMNCLISIPADRREEQMLNPNSFCNRLSR